MYINNVRVVGFEQTENLLQHKMHMLLWAPSTVYRSIQVCRVYTTIHPIQIIYCDISLRIYIYRALMLLLERRENP